MRNKKSANNNYIIGTFIREIKLKVITFNHLKA